MDILIHLLAQAIVRNFRTHSKQGAIRGTCLALASSPFIPALVRAIFGPEYIVSLSFGFILLTVLVGALLGAKFGTLLSSSGN